MCYTSLLNIWPGGQTLSTHIHAGIVLLAKIIVRVFSFFLPLDKSDHLSFWNSSHLTTWVFKRLGCLIIRQSPVRYLVVVLVKTLVAVFQTNLWEHIEQNPTTLYCVADTQLIVYFNTCFVKYMLSALAHHCLVFIWHHR